MAAMTPMSQQRSRHSQISTISGNQEPQHVLISCRLRNSFLEFREASLEESDVLMRSMSERASRRAQSADSGLAAQRNAEFGSLLPSFMYGGVPSPVNLSLSKALMTDPNGKESMAISLTCPEGDHHVEATCGSPTRSRRGGGLRPARRRRGGTAAKGTSNSTPQEVTWLAEAGNGGSIWQGQEYIDGLAQQYDFCGATNFHMTTPSTTSGSESPTTSAAVSEVPTGSRSGSHSEDEHSENQGPATTVMIRHIACQYTQEQVATFLDDEGFQGDYDFIYVPMNAAKRANLGYLFVNFNDVESVERCKAQLTGKVLGTSRTEKRCDVSLAHVQGAENIARHFNRKAVLRSKHSPMFVGKPLPAKQQVAEALAAIMAQ